MASGVVSTKTCSAATDLGDEESRSRAPAPRVTHARVSTREATIASPWAALSAPAALGLVVAKAWAHSGERTPS